MSTYPNLKKDTELLKVKTKDDEIKDLKFKTEKHNIENILKSLKIKLILKIIKRSINVQIKRKYF